MSSAIALIHEENGVFGVSFPDFPGCITTADSLDAALERGAQALAFHIEGMIDDGETMPELRTPGQLRADASLKDSFDGATLAAVRADLPAKSVRINISIEATLLQRLDRAAANAGQSRSAFLAGAVRSRINALMGRDAA